MISQEAIEILNSFKEKEWVNKIPTLNINLPWCEVELNLTGINNILEFLNDQKIGWSNSTQSIGELTRSNDYFKNSLVEVISFLKRNTANNADACTINWHTIQRDLEHAQTTRPHIFTFDSPITIFIEKLASENPEIARMSMNFLSGQNGEEIRYRNNFVASLRTYLFQHPGLEILNDRAEMELSSLEEIRKSQHKKTLEYSQFISEQLQKNNHLVESYNQSFADLKKSSEEEFTNWFNGVNHQFEEFDKNTLQKIKDYEELYTNKLRLEAPAHYWNKRAEKLKKEGRKMLYWLIGFVSVCTLLLYMLLWHSPKDMLESIFTGDKGSAIRWSIVFIIFLSFVAYGIRVLAKAMFSAFHLARDAEEREQLTHVYLALQKDNAVTDADKALILQSIFSRADTGLLKDDSAPVMPSAVTEKITSRS